MKKNYLTLMLLCVYFLPLKGENLHHLTEEFTEVDLELTMNTPDLTPEVFTSISATIILTNTGTETANNISVAVPVPAGFVLVGSNPYDLSAGIYSDFTNIWNLNNLEPGASETLTLNIFTLSENTVELYGQVTAMDGSDVDSTPGNGTPAVPNEDDEAVLVFNGVSGPGLPDLTIANLTAPGSISLSTDYTLEYQISNIGESTAPGPFTVYFYYSEDNQLNLGDQQFGQVTYSDFSAGASQVEEYSFVFLSSIGITPGTGYIIANIDNDNTVPELNENNNVAISNQVTVSAVNNNAGIDLEVFLHQANNDPDQYSSYPVQLSVFNNGNETATNVKVSVPRPAGVVYSGSNPFTLNIGQFSAFSDIYSIASLAPGATAQLTLNYYLLDEHAPGVYAQVTNANETDTDSTPNNGTPPTPNEDDEASTETGTPPVNTPLCATDLMIMGGVNCIQPAQNSEVEIYVTNEDADGNTIRFIKTVDSNGALVNTQNLGEILPEITYAPTNLTDQNNILQKLENGVVIEEMIIPPSITDNYETISGATAFNTGFIIFAVDGGNLIAILTDENLNPVLENMLPSRIVFTPKLEKAIQIAPDQIAIVYSDKNAQVGTIINLLVINENLETLSEQLLTTGQFASGDIQQTICGDYSVSASSFTNGFFSGSQFSSSSRLLGNFVNGEFISTSSRVSNSSRQSTPNGIISSFSFSHGLSTADGGTVTATGDSNSDGLLIQKVLNNNIVLNKTIELEDFILQLTEISGDIFIIARQNESGGLVLYDLECLEDISSPENGVDLELTSLLSQNAPDIYSNYSVVYTLVNNGTLTATGIEVSFSLPSGTVYQGENPFSISQGDMSTFNNLFTLAELPAGESVTIQLNYFSLTDSQLNHYAEVVAANEEDADSTPDNGTPPSVNEDDETAVSTGPRATTNAALNPNENQDIKRLEILKLYPNPVMEGDIRMAINIPEAAEQTFLVFDELGVEILRTSFELSAGFNEVSLPTKNLTAGIYHVLLPGYHVRFIAARFVVIR